MKNYFTAPSIQAYPGVAQQIIGTMREMHSVRMMDLCSILRYDAIDPYGMMHTYSPPAYIPGEDCEFSEWRRRYRRAAERHFQEIQDDANAKKSPTSDFSSIEKEIQKEIFDEQLEIFDNLLSSRQPKKAPWWKLW